MKIKRLSDGRYPNRLWTFIPVLIQEVEDLDWLRHRLARVADVELYISDEFVTSHVGWLVTDRSTKWFTFSRDFVKLLRELVTSHDHHCQWIHLDAATLVQYRTYCRHAFIGQWSLRVVQNHRRSMQILWNLDDQLHDEALRQIQIDPQTGALATFVGDRRVMDEALDYLALILHSIYGLARS